MFTDEFCREMENPETEIKRLEEGIAASMAMGLDLFERIQKREGRLDTRNLSIARTELEASALRLLAHQGECVGSSIQDAIQGI
jgi:hypothetical protein